MDSKGKKGGFMPLFIVMAASLVIAGFWDKYPLIKDSVGAVLNPTLGWLIKAHLEIGMTLIVLAISGITTLVQKHMTDQEYIKSLKAQQKDIQKRAEEYKEHPEKMLEVQKELGPLTLELMRVNMRPIMFTGIPFILLFRWFYDLFTAIGNPHLFGFFSWFWFYFLFSIIFGSILRKVLKVE